MADPFFTGNLTWSSGKLRQDSSLNNFGDEDPETPIATILEWVIKPLALYGGVDVFIYIQVDRKYESSPPVWDGDPFTYEQTLGDISMCKLYSEHAIFQANRGNHVYCLNEYEQELSNPFIENFPFWSYYYYADIPLSKEMLLQQLYGIYRANLGSKQIELSKGFKYSYKLRLRPDVAAVKEFPILDAIKVHEVNSNCPTTIWYPSLIFYRLGGAEDSFNFGLAEVNEK